MLEQEEQTVHSPSKNEIYPSIHRLTGLAGSEQHGILGSSRAYVG